MDRMRKRLVDYRKRIDTLLDESPDNVNWDATIEEHLVQIGFFQHERHIHLLVTLAFALMTLGAALTAVLTSQITVVALMLMLLVLLVPYIVHYYHLENDTQKLYAQYDRMLEKRRAQTAPTAQTAGAEQEPDER